MCFCMLSVLDFEVYEGLGRSETHGRDQVRRIMVKQNGAIFSKTMLRRMCFEVSQNFAMIFRSLLPQLFG